MATAAMSPGEGTSFGPARIFVSPAWMKGKHKLTDLATARIEEYRSIMIARWIHHDRVTIETTKMPPCTSLPSHIQLVCCTSPSRSVASKTIIIATPRDVHGAFPQAEVWISHAELAEVVEVFHRQWTLSKPSRRPVRFLLAEISLQIIVTIDVEFVKEQVLT